MFKVLLLGLFVDSIRKKEYLLQMFIKTLKVCDMRKDILSVCFCFSTLLMRQFCESNLILHISKLWKLQICTVYCKYLKLKLDTGCTGTVV